MPNQTKMHWSDCGTNSVNVEKRIKALTKALKLLSVRINPKDSKCTHCWCNAWDWTKHSLKCKAIRAALIESPDTKKEI